MYADPRPLFLVVGVVMLGLAVWVSYVLVAMREPWPASKKASRPLSEGELKPFDDVFLRQDDRPKND